MKRGGLFAGEDPVAIARRWLDEAMRAELRDANAMALATVGRDGMPNARMVLLKEIEPLAQGGGFLFYTHRSSVKGQELAQNPRAALLFHWKSLNRQIRIQGPVECVEAAKSDAYFASRPLTSRLGAWASAQSQPLASRAALMARVTAMGAKYLANPPRPPHWGGYRLRPLTMEFWAEGAYRLHDRFRWCRASAEATEWEVTRLNP